MDISSLNSTKLRSLISLTEQREKLAAQLEKLDAAILEVLSKSAPQGAKRGRPASATLVPGSSESHGKRGALKEKILAELKAAGKDGVSVKALSAKLGVKNQNVHVWFATTGKTVGVKKIGPGKYRL